MSNKKDNKKSIETLLYKVNVFKADKYVTTIKVTTDESIAFLYAEKYNERSTSSDRKAIITIE